jgi:FkbM family methyltransferase
MIIELLKSRRGSCPYLYHGLKKIYQPWQSWKSRQIIKNKTLLPYLIEQSLKDNPWVFFIQIGANDGKTGDPLYPLISTHNNWGGIFIEPIKHIFEKLKENYQGTNRFIFENVAIANDYNIKNFYYVSDRAKDILEDLPHWYDKLGSFDKTHIIRHFNGKLEPFIVEDEVIGVPLKDILIKHKVDNIDLIHIDTEGFDYQILAQIDFTKYHPKVILFEHKHLSVDDKRKAIKLLYNNSYKVYNAGEDYLAIKTNNLLYICYLQLLANLVYTN